MASPISSPRSRLSLILWLVALHSACVGVGLLVFPDTAFERFGYHPISERFFAAQGGVFHLIMAVVYAMAGARVDRYEILILVSLGAKFSATVFLFTYYLFFSAIWMVLLSGIGDALMGILIFAAWMAYRKVRA